jgi:uncharacterized protein (DUF4415 family)
MAREAEEARRAAFRYADEMTDEEDARLTAAAESDPDARPWTDEQWAKARPAREVLPPEMFERLTRKPGGRGPQKAPTKQLVSLRLDREIIEHFKAQGPGWQTRLNDALRAAVQAAEGPEPVEPR